MESSLSLTAPRTIIRSSNGRLQFSKITSSSSIKLTSENGQISCLDCNSPNQDIETHSGHLEGSFNVNDALILKTNTGGIDAKVKVLEPSEENKNREVTVSATSKAGRVSVDYLDQAKGVLLTSTVKSDVGAADVNHAKYYQGDWKVKTKVGSAHVEANFEDSDHHFKVVSDQRRIPGVS